MSGSEALGWTAGAFATLSVIPQIVQVFRLRSAHEISLLFSSLLLIGLLMWLGYGIAKGLFPVIMWNSIGVILAGTLLYAKIRYGR